MTQILAATALTSDLLAIGVIGWAHQRLLDTVASACDPEPHL